MTAVCATALGAVYWHQEALLFQPAPLPKSHSFAIPDTREVSIEVEGATLSALHLRVPNPKGVVFFLHGNGGNLASWFTNPGFYRRVNYDLFMIDYRGYGKSTGRIESEGQLRADVRRAWDWVAPQYAGKANVIYGRSLGSALAGGLAAEIQPALTILVSPYCSMAELARLHYPLIPTALLRYPLFNLRRCRPPAITAAAPARRAGRDHPDRAERADPGAGALGGACAHCGCRTQRRASV